MKPSSQFLIDSIANTIERDVLPELEPSTWTASRLRSCLMLLRHLEQRVPAEGPLLFEENVELRKFLGPLVEALSDHAGGADLAKGLAGLESEAARDYPSVDDLVKTNDEYQILLDAAICVLHEGRDTLGEPRFSELHESILIQLRKCKHREGPMINAAAGYSPI